jgi:hypothetical protein
MQHTLVSPTWSEGEGIVWGSTSTFIVNIRRVSMKSRVGRVCRDLGLDNFHSWLNTLKRLLGKRVTILVGVELFGQFPVKLGESGFGHRLHTLFDEIFGSVHEFINQKYLVYLSLLTYFIINVRLKVVLRKLKRFWIYFFFDLTKIFRSWRLFTCTLS